MNCCPSDACRGREDLRDHLVARACVDDVRRRRRSGERREDVVAERHAGVQVRLRPTEGLGTGIAAGRREDVRREDERVLHVAHLRVVEEVVVVQVVGVSAEDAPAARRVGVVRDRDEHPLGGRVLMERLSHCVPAVGDVVVVDPRVEYRGPGVPEERRQLRVGDQSSRLVEHGDLRVRDRRELTAGTLAGGRVRVRRLPAELSCGPALIRPVERGDERRRAQRCRALNLRRLRRPRCGRLRRRILTRGDDRPVDVRVARPLRAGRTCAEAREARDLLMHVCGRKRRRPYLARCEWGLVSECDRWKHDCNCKDAANGGEQTPTPRLA